jgi:uncharacterized protein
MKLSRRLETRDDVEDFVHGLVLYGTGGGGGPAGPIVDRLMAAGAAGASIGWVDISELPDDAWCVSVGGVGGRTPPGGPDPAVLRRCRLGEPVFADSKDMQVAAARTLAGLAGVELGALVAVELGSGNTVIPLLVGLELGIPLVDGDYCGRAKPEIQMSILELEGRGPCPLVFLDRWGDVVHLPSAASTPMVDRIGRELCTAAQGGIASARSLLPAAEAARCVVRGSCEAAFQAGRTLREARASGRDPVEAVVERLGGILAFQGTVERTEEDPASGYQFRLCTHHLRGTGASKGRTCSIWVKNEHHVLWVDGEPLVTSPDIIAVLARPAGRPLTNAEIQPGLEVAVIGAPPLDPRWRTPEGIDLFGPPAFGFTFDYRPVDRSGA